MKVSIEEVDGGFIVKYEDTTLPKVYESTRTLQMLEEVGKRVFGKRVRVEEK